MGEGRKRPSIGKTIATSMGLGVALTWALVFVIPTAERLGLSHGKAQKIPLLGLALGIVWGIALRSSDNARAALRYVTAPLLLGAVLWFFFLLAGGVLVALGVPPGIADLVPILGFAIGAGLGMAPFIVRILEPFYARRR